MVNALQVIFALLVLTGLGIDVIHAVVPICMRISVEMQCSRLVHTCICHETFATFATFFRASKWIFGQIKDSPFLLTHRA